MELHEPEVTALILMVLGLLMGAAVLFSRAAGRFGVPVTLLFLATGMVAGTEGLGKVAFDDYALTFRLGTVALVLILFDGGLNTPMRSLRDSVRPAAVLATVGVVGTAAVVGVAARLFGFSWPSALLLGAIVSSTDAAAVFSVLRGSGLALQKRVGLTLELESGINDPMAVILTMSLTRLAVTGGELGLALLGEVAVQLSVGGALGIAFGYGGRLLLKHVRLPAAGLYPVLTLSLAFLAFGLPTLFHGSGLLAVYVSAVLLGSEAIRYRTGLLRVHDGLAWLAQVGMFLMLGLLSYPSQLMKVSGVGLGLGLVLALVARPLVVVLCLLPFRYPLKEAFYVGWVGLRGAVPIILATFPVLANAPGAPEVFNVVFFIVVVNALVPGATVGWVTRKLDLVSAEPPPVPAVLEITSTQVLQGDLIPYYVHPASAVAGATISELPFPPSAVMTLIVRGSDLVAPRGSTRIEVGDHAYVFCKPDDLPFVQLIFGQHEQE